MDIEEYSWVVASEYRENMLLTLKGKPKTPKQIAEATDYYLSHVSNTLSDLKDHGLVKCLTPDRRKGRLYALTDAGEKMVKDLER